MAAAPAAGTALALETLKRALSLDNRSRDSLVSAALSVGLVQLLLQRLDWRQKQAGEATSEVPILSPAPACCLLSFCHFWLPCLLCVLSPGSAAWDASQMRLQPGMSIASGMHFNSTGQSAGQVHCIWLLLESQ